MKPVRVSGMTKYIFINWCDSLIQADSLIEAVSSMLSDFKCVSVDNHYECFYTIKHCKPAKLAMTLSNEFTYTEAVKEFKLKLGKDLIKETYVNKRFARKISKQ